MAPNRTPHRRTVRKREAVSSPRRAWLAVARRISVVCRDLSLREIARRTCCNHETIRRYMRLTNEPGASFLVQLVRVFGVDPAWLLTGKGARPARSSKSTRPPRTTKGSPRRGARPQRSKPRGR